MNHYRSYSENQLLFETNLSGLKLFTKRIGITLLRLPLIVTGYMVANYFLDSTNNFWIRLALTIGFAYLAYLIIYFVKGIIIRLKSKKSFWWVPILAIVVFFVCILPVLMLLQSDFNLIRMIRNIHFAPAFVVSIYLVYTYSSYRFLTNIAPRSVYAVYKAGIMVADNLVHLKTQR